MHVYKLDVWMAGMDVWNAHVSQRVERRCVYIDMCHESVCIEHVLGWLETRLDQTNINDLSEEYTTLNYTHI